MTTLVSYPRTGSHLLRLALSLYAYRPCLPEAFLLRFTGEPLLTHTHDLGLDHPEGDVIYLWREDAVSVVYSNLAYLAPRRRDPLEIAREYVAHVAHWRERANVVVTYEELVDNQADVIDALAGYLGAFEAAPGPPFPEITRELVAALTVDARAVPQGEVYERRRAHFERRYGERIEELMCEVGT